MDAHFQCSQDACEETGNSPRPELWECVKECFTIETRQIKSSGCAFMSMLGCLNWVFFMSAGSAGFMGFGMLLYYMLACWHSKACRTSEQNLVLPHVSSSRSLQRTGPKQSKTHAPTGIGLHWITIPYEII